MQCAALQIVPTLTFQFMHPRIVFGFKFMKRTMYLVVWYTTEAEVIESNKYNIMRWHWGIGQFNIHQLPRLNFFHAGYLLYVTLQTRVHTIAPEHFTERECVCFGTARVYADLQHI